jgi:hypothetical protein
VRIVRVYAIGQDERKLDRRIEDFDLYYGPDEDGYCIPEN